MISVYVFVLQRGPATLTDPVQGFVDRKLLKLLRGEGPEKKSNDFRQATESARADVARVVAGLVTAAESDVGSLVQVEAGSCRALIVCLSPK